MQRLSHLRRSVSRLASTSSALPSTTPNLAAYRAELSTLSRSIRSLCRSSIRKHPHAALARLFHTSRPKRTSPNVPSSPTSSTTSTSTSSSSSSPPPPPPRVPLFTPVTLLLFLLGCGVSAVIALDIYYSVVQELAEVQEWRGADTDIADFEQVTVGAVDPSSPLTRAARNESLLQTLVLAPMRALKSLLSSTAHACRAAFILVRFGPLFAALGLLLAVDYAWAATAAHPHAVSPLLALESNEGHAAALTPAHTHPHAHAHAHAHVSPSLVPLAPPPSPLRPLYAAWWQLFARALEHSGPTFTKLGQYLSSRPDILSPGVCALLAGLRDNTEPHAWAETERTLEEELGEDWENYIRVLPHDRLPIGSGCIAQVYKAYVQLPAAAHAAARGLHSDAQGALHGLHGDPSFAAGAVVAGETLPSNLDVRYVTELPSQAHLEGLFEDPSALPSFPSLLPSFSTLPHNTHNAYTHPSLPSPSPSSSSPSSSPSSSLPPPPSPSSEHLTVAIKVLHPHARWTIHRDLRLLHALASLADTLPLSPFSAVSFRSLSLEFARLMHAQLDLTQEARNLSRFASNFPRPHEGLTIRPHFPVPLCARRRVLVESFHTGLPVAVLMRGQQGRPHRPLEVLEEAKRLGTAEDAAKVMAAVSTAVEAAAGDSEGGNGHAGAGAGIGAGAGVGAGVGAGAGVGVGGGVPLQSLSAPAAAPSLPPSHPRHHRHHHAGRVCDVSEQITEEHLRWWAELPADTQDWLRRATAKCGLDTFLHMLFAHGFFHADLHPGNMLLDVGYSGDQWATAIAAAHAAVRERRREEEKTRAREERRARREGGWRETVREWVGTARNIITDIPDMISQAFTPSSTPPSSSSPWSSWCPLTARGWGAEAEGEAWEWDASVLMPSEVFVTLHPDDMRLHDFASTPRAAFRAQGLPLPLAPPRLVMLDAGMSTALSQDDQRNFNDLFLNVATGRGYEAAALLIERAQPRPPRDDMWREHLRRCRAWNGSGACLCGLYGPGEAVPVPGGESVWVSRLPLNPRQTAEGRQRFVQTVGDLAKAAQRDSFALGGMGVVSTLQSLATAARECGVPLDSAFVSVVIAVTVMEGVGRALDPTCDVLGPAVTIVAKCGVQKAQRVLVGMLDSNALPSVGAGEGAAAHAQALGHKGASAQTATHTAAATAAGAAGAGSGVGVGVVKVAKP